MRLGIDFDNTIVCYDQVFHQVALELGVIPAHLAVSKQAVRDHLRCVGNEERWTQMQGYVYGPRLRSARPFPGALDFIRDQVRLGVDVFIVSHKTRHPYLGPQYDLHEAALGWLEAHGVFDAERIGLPRQNVFLELTKQDKLARIAALRCTHFIDDLPELLAEPGFPSGVTRLLFDPNGEHVTQGAFARVGSWHTLSRELQAA